jgi:hypothetical protein
VAPGPGLAEGVVLAAPDLVEGTVAFCMDATVTRNAGVVALLKVTRNGGVGC